MQIIILTIFIHAILAAPIPVEYEKIQPVNHYPELVKKEKGEGAIEGTAQWAAGIARTIIHPIDAAENATMGIIETVFHPLNAINNIEKGIKECVKDEYNIEKCIVSGGLDALTAVAVPGVISKVATRTAETANVIKSNSLFQKVRMLKPAEAAKWEASSLASKAKLATTAAEADVFAEEAFAQAHIAFEDATKAVSTAEKAHLDLEATAASQGLEVKHEQFATARKDLASAGITESRSVANAFDAQLSSIKASEQAALKASAALDEAIAAKDADEVRKHLAILERADVNTKKVVGDLSAARDHASSRLKKLSTTDRKYADMQKQVNGFSAEYEKASSTSSHLSKLREEAMAGEFPTKVMKETKIPTAATAVPANAAENVVINEEGLRVMDPIPIAEEEVPLTKTPKEATPEKVKPTEESTDKTWRDHLPSAKSVVVNGAAGASILRTTEILNNVHQNQQMQSNDQ